MKMFHRETAIVMSETLIVERRYIFVRIKKIKRKKKFIRKVMLLLCERVIEFETSV